ncbi:hypothetical protein ACFL1M_04210, partial [Patescibacteria group bacterium]
GQEDGNLDIIKQYKLGFVEENPIKATKLIQEIFNSPKKIHSLSKSIKKIADYNENAKNVLIDTIREQVHS